jgi:hypothetical protein
VLFVSLHRRDGDFYPAGCGFATEVGSGKVGPHELAGPHCSSLGVSNTQNNVGNQLCNGCMLLLMTLHCAAGCDPLPDKGALLLKLCIRS